MCNVEVVIAAAPEAVTNTSQPSFTARREALLDGATTGVRIVPPETTFGGHEFTSHLVALGAAVPPRRFSAGSSV
jgi:hypothetical protein